MINEWEIHDVQEKDEINRNYDEKELRILLEELTDKTNIIDEIIEKLHKQRIKIDAQNSIGNTTIILSLVLIKTTYNNIKERISNKWEMDQKTMTLIENALYQEKLTIDIMEKQVYAENEMIIDQVFNFILLTEINVMTTSNNRLTWPTEYAKSAIVDNMIHKTKEKLAEIMIQSDATMTTNDEIQRIVDAMPKTTIILSNYYAKDHINITANQQTSKQLKEIETSQISDEERENKYRNPSMADIEQSIYSKYCGDMNKKNRILNEVIKESILVMKNASNVEIVVTLTNYIIIGFVITCCLSNISILPPIITSEIVKIAIYLATSLVLIITTIKTSFMSSDNIFNIDWLIKLLVKTEPIIPMLEARKKRRENQYKNFKVIPELKLNYKK